MRNCCGPRHDVLSGTVLIAVPSVFGEGAFINTVLQTQIGWGKKNKEKNLLNPMKNPLIQRLVIVLGETAHIKLC